MRKHNVNLRKVPRYHLQAGDAAIPFRLLFYEDVTIEDGEGRELVARLLARFVKILFWK